MIAKALLFLWSRQWFFSVQHTFVQEIFFEDLHSLFSRVDKPLSRTKLALLIVCKKMMYHRWKFLRVILGMSC